MAKQATHKLSGLGTLIRTAVPEGELPEIITAAAADARGSAITSPGKAEIENVRPGEVLLAVRDAFKRVLMTFTVTTAKTADAKTEIRTHIDSFSTHQSTFLFIPVGPKILNGKLAYTHFLDSLERRIRERDDSCAIQRVGQA